jgi:hypothetical protein
MIRPSVINILVTEANNYDTVKACLREDLICLYITEGTVSDQGGRCRSTGSPDFRMKIARRASTLTSTSSLFPSGFHVVTHPIFLLPLIT